MNQLFLLSRVVIVFIYVNLIPICFLAGDIQRLPDALGSTLFKFLLAPDTVSIEHLSIEAVQVSLSLKHFKHTMFLYAYMYLGWQRFLQSLLPYNTIFLNQNALYKFYYSTLTVFYFLAHCPSC